MSKGTTAAVLLAALAVPAAASAQGLDFGDHPSALHRAMPDFDPLALGASAPLDQGRGALLATVADMIGRVYDGAKLKLGLDAPDPVPEPARPVLSSLEALSLGTLSVSRLSLKADPRAYESNGLAADAALSALGLDSRMGVQVGTEHVRQNIWVKGDCGTLWLPNEVTSSLDSHIGGGGPMIWSGYVRSAWGTACGAGQPGWRLTAGIRDLGRETVGSLGLEYRPHRWESLPELTGVTAMRASVVGAAGQVGAELDLGALRGTPLKLDAGFGWHAHGAETLRIATRLTF